MERLFIMPKEALRPDIRAIEGVGYSAAQIAHY